MNTVTPYEKLYALSSLNSQYQKSVYGLADNGHYTPVWENITQDEYNQIRADMASFEFYREPGLVLYSLEAQMKLEAEYLAWHCLAEKALYKPERAMRYSKQLVAVGRNGHVELDMEYWGDLLPV